MSAVPAYSYSSSSNAERALNRPQRPEFSILPGRGAQAAPAAAPSALGFAVAVIVTVLVAFTCVACVRIALSSATAATAKESQQLSSSIDEARSAGAALEVAQGSLANPTRVRDMAKALGMAAPETTGVIVLEDDIVVVDDAGDLSLAGSVAAASAHGA